MTIKAKLKFSCIVPNDDNGENLYKMIDVNGFFEKESGTTRRNAERYIIKGQAKSSGLVGIIKIYFYGTQVEVSQN